MLNVLAHESMNEKPEISPFDTDLGQLLKVTSLRTGHLQAVSTKRRARILIVVQTDNPFISGEASDEPQWSPCPECCLAKLASIPWVLP